MAEYRTNKGQIINMDELRQKNEKSIAVGNMNVNAKGDLLGKGGEIKKTAKERTKPYYNDNPKAVKQVGIKSMSMDDEELEKDIPESLDDVDKDEKKKEETKSKATRKSKSKKSSTQTKKPTIDKSREKELDDGSIEIMDDTNEQKDKDNKDGE